MEYMNSKEKFSHHSHHPHDFHDDENWVRYMLALAKDPAGQTTTSANADDEDDAAVEHLLRLAGQGGDLR